ncbi:transient receptor potential cation channel, putative, partial [Ixodes scapularis]
GASMTATDKEGRSVILLAAARGAWKTVTTLLTLGADLTVKDNLRRNLLHHIVLSGGCLDDFYNEINERLQDFALLLNERDMQGCTAMHYASRNGQLKTIEGLLQYGRYNTVRHLLESKKGHLIINEMDGEGKTPLHIASQNGHTRVVHLLLVKGALLHRDHRGRTPLHYAVTNGFTHTMEQLLAVHSHLLDQSDRDGIGLAVGDIETVRRNAQLKRLTMQVELHTDLERKLPRRILTIVDKTEVYVYPNQKGSSSYVWQTLQRWFASPKENGKRGRAFIGSSALQDSAMQDLCDELTRQKRRMKDISRAMEQQLSLLRLIVTKMDIRAETDDRDEGYFESVQDRPLSATGPGTL